MVQLCFPLRPLLSKEKEWGWTDDHERAFAEMKKAVPAITEKQHFKRNQPMRDVCDASRGSRAVLQQRTELAEENSNNYVYGTEF